MDILKPRGKQNVHDEYVVECQATFKEHCTFPKCDCDCNYDNAETNPVHGGKIWEG